MTSDQFHFKIFGYDSGVIICQNEFLRNTENFNTLYYIPILSILKLIKMTPGVSKSPPANG